MKRQVITRTFGLEPAPRCPQCGKLAQKKPVYPGTKTGREDHCPQCQRKLAKDPAPKTHPTDMVEFAQAVNILIKQGINRPNQLFRLDTLKSVKAFYNVLSKDKKVQHVLNQLQIQGRAKRCAAQYAYFAIREHKRYIQEIKILAPLIAQEVRQEGLKRLQGDEFPSYSLVRQCTSRLRQELGTRDVMERQELVNRLKHIRNLLYAVLKTRLEAQDPRVVQVLKLSVPLPTELDQRIQDATTEWSQRFVKHLSRLLTQRIKRNKKKVRPSWGQGHLDELIEAIMDQPIATDAQGRTTIDLAHWQLARRAWRDDLLAELQQSPSPPMREEQKGVSDVSVRSLSDLALTIIQTQLAPTYLLKQVFKPRLARFWFSIRPSDDWARYQVHQLIEEVKETHLARQLPQLTELILQACRTVGATPAAWLKLPRYEAQSIPLGLDDNRVYKLGQERDPAINPQKDEQEDRPDEVFVRLTLRPHEPVDYRVHTPQRWLDLVAQGYHPQKPVLHKRPGGGPLLLSVPFKCPPATSSSPPPDFSFLSSDSVSTSVDLGIKTLAVLSLTQGVQPITWVPGTSFQDLAPQFLDAQIETHELARFFLTQDHLARPAQTWFHSPPSHASGPSSNVKRHLFHLREEAHRLQHQKDTYRAKHPTIYRRRVKYKRLKREWQRIWRHIGGIHDDMAKQIALRIVSVSQAYYSQRIRFEDLRWSQHTAKEETGYWLATWQIHWFHGQIIRYTQEFAARVGITVELVFARGTSSRCSSCGHIGDRAGKLFTCPHCHRQLDSDLNAARNIAVAPNSPSARRARGELPYPVGNAGESSDSSSSQGIR